MEEIKTTSPTNTFLDSFDYNHHMKVIVKSARGASKSILIGKSEFVFDVLDTLISTFCLMVVVRRSDGWIQISLQYTI